DDPQGRAHVQPARCTRRDLGDRACRVHRAHSRAVAAGGPGVCRFARGARVSDAARGAAHGCGTFGGMIEHLPALVVEIITEELPPKALKALGAAFADTLVAELARRA